MGIPVVTGGKAMCSMGLGVFNLTAAGNVMIENKPVLTTKDIAFGANIAPMGAVMCQSLANPMVASATAAALGVLTPQPCTLVPAGMWIPGTMNCRVKGIGIVDSSCSLMCAYAGKISITFPGAVKTTVK